VATNLETITKKLQGSTPLARWEAVRPAGQILHRMDINPIKRHTGTRKKLPAYELMDVERVSENIPAPDSGPHDTSPVRLATILPQCSNEFD
jgi:hypothetical protein